MCFTTKHITPLSVSLQRIPKGLYFNLKYLNYYLRIFSKNLDLDFYCYRPRDTSGISNKTVKARP
jgi:hypothetical protein